MNCDFSFPAGGFCSHSSHGPSACFGPARQGAGVYPETSRRAADTALHRPGWFHKTRISPRDQSISSNQVDLSTYYNGGLGENRERKSALSGSFPRGLQVPIHGPQVLNNPDFDARGVVLLASTNTAWKDDDLFWPRPSAVNGIRIEAKATHLHFLHAADWEDSNGSRIGTYRVDYAKKESIEIPIVYGQNIRRWFGEQPGTLVSATVAWAGKRSDNEESAQLYRFTWENPLRDVAIETIDFVSAVATAAPCLVALTLE